MGPYYYSTEFLFFKAIVNSKYSSILGTMLYFWLLKGMLRSIFCVDMNTHTDRKWKIMQNLSKKVFIDLFYRYHYLPPLFHLLRLHVTLFVCNM